MTSSQLAVAPPRDWRNNGFASAALASDAHEARIALFSFKVRSGSFDDVRRTGESPSRMQKIFEIRFFSEATRQRPGERLSENRGTFPLLHAM